MKRNLVFVFCLMAYIVLPFFDKNTYAAELPEQVLIRNVPYISWDEMSARDYPDKEIANPSLAASMEMVAQYWASEHEEYSSKEDWELESRNAANFEEIQRLLAKEVPVRVSLPLTPSAHPVYPLWVAFLAAIGEERLCDAIEQQRSRTTGILGTFISFGLIRETQKCMEKENFMEGKYFWDSVFRADRVVIGYDTTKQTVTLHDPAFGPALEIPKKEFMQMWDVTNRDYFVHRPLAMGSSVSKREGSSLYPQRTAKQKATQAYIFAYGDAATGRLDSAKASYTALVKGQNTPQDIRHLALLELAHLALFEGIRSRLLILQKRQ